MAKHLFKTSMADMDFVDSNNGRTPLSLASEDGDLMLVKTLLQTDTTDADLRDTRWGRTPLSWAAGSGHEAVVKLLLDTGKVDADSKGMPYRTPRGGWSMPSPPVENKKWDTNLKDAMSGRTPLSWAAEGGHEAVVKLLLDTGNVDADSKYLISGRTPLSWAAEYGHEMVVKLLLDSGKVDADSKDIMSGRTPLSWAAESGQEAVVKLLLDTGKVDAYLKDKSGRTPLSLAAENGHEAIVKLLLDIGKVDPDLRDRSVWTVVSPSAESSKADADSKDTTPGRTPLLLAAGNGHKTVVDLLLDTGRVDPDCKDEYGMTPLSSAARKGHESIVKALLDTGRVDPDSKDTMSGRTPLSWAGESGYGAVVKLLLDTGRVNPDSKDEHGVTPLSWAAQNGHETIVKALLDTGRVDPDSKDASDRTPLFWSATSGHKAVVKLLLDTGNVDPNSEGDWDLEPLWWTADYGRNRTGKFDVDSRDKRLRRTPLSLAAENGHEEVVKLLLDNDKVHADLKDTASGQTALLWAARSGHEMIVKLLLDSDKVDADVKDKLGRTPLCLAARSGHLQVVKQLLDTGKPDPNLKDECSATPLLWAAQNGHLQVVKRLLDTRKVDPNLGDECGGTPLLWAARNGHKMIVKMLLDDGIVKTNVKDTASGQTPLSWAARNGHEDVVNLFLDSGEADPDWKDEHGMTPLLWASENGHEAIVKLLHDTGRMDENLKAKVGLEIANRFLTRWIKACDDRHDGYCQPIPVQKRRPQQIPAWVIDTWDSCIVPGHTVSQYTALSYVWHNDEANAQSPREERLLLKQSNLPEFQKPGYLSGTAALHLSQVIKDAIDVVRKIEERYLWVDCLCIVQDNRNTRAQVEHMDDIYSGAYFTIIAATSSELFRMRRNTEKQRMGTISLFNPSPAKSYIERLYQNLFNSKWATRGWTFQEQILSKRAVIFVDGDMFWDCQRCVWDKGELIPGSNVETNGSYTGPYYEIARQISSISWPDFGTYIELVCLYNSRDLTYPQDSLPAFSGVLNSLARSFSFGFVGGLPQLFLDYALLWQPYSKAKRRYAKDGGAVAPPRHLPSWSWCGWQCLVDPFSLRTGLAYVDREDYQSRALTWQTQRLVQWSVLSEDMQQEQRIDGPITLEQYKHLRTNQNVKLPEGWSRKTDNGPESSGGSDSVYFTHTSDTINRFKHPVPINDAASSANLNQNIWPFLSCEATRAFFRIGTILKPSNGLTKQAGLKLSVFELPQFTEGPAFEDICHVLRLEDRQGRSAGLLRQMDGSEIEFGGEIELIAISTGSVSCAELESAFEEKIDRVGSYSYRHGLTTIWFEQVLPSGSIENDSKNETSRNLKSPFIYQDNTRPAWRSARGNRFPDAERDASDAVKDDDSEGDYHFYNVLWIERQGDIAYRRAAGRVPKVIWEENCSKPIKVVLG